MSDKFYNGDDYPLDGQSDWREAFVRTCSKNDKGKPHTAAILKNSDQRFLQSTSDNDRHEFPLLFLNICAKPSGRDVRYRTPEHCNLIPNCTIKRGGYCRGRAGPCPSRVKRVAQD
jgi:hypothetical protein